MVGIGVVELVILLFVLSLPILGYKLLKKKGNLFAQIIGGTLTVIFVILMFYFVIFTGLFGILG